MDQVNILITDSYKVNHGIYNDPIKEGCYKTIYRLEKVNTTTNNDISIGKGPYQAFNKLSDELCEAHKSENVDENFEPIYPGARIDFEEIVTSKHYFGCPSLDKLKAWFDNGFLEKHLDSGYKVFKYTVTESFLSNSEKQSMFHEQSILSKEEVILQLQ